MKKKRFAVFDIDGTIFRSSLLIELVNALVDEGVFKPSVARGYSRSKREWLDRKGAYEDYIMSVVSVFQRAVKNVQYEDFLRVAKKVVRAHRDRVYRYTRDLVRDLRRQGYYMVAISHSPRAIVGIFGTLLGFDKIYGLYYELDAKGRFTGKILYRDFMLDKAQVVKRVVEKHGLTLRGSVGVGDTESDIPFLRLVDKPICFNPNRKLFKAARRRGWKVVVERKDVVYEM